MILSNKVISSILNFRKKAQKVRRPVMAMIKACSRGGGSGKGEEEVSSRQLSL